MKKIFKIALSAILCIAFLLVPMTATADEGIDYNINYEIFLTEGTSNYAIDSTVPYTVYYLYPSAVGDYTITSSDCVMGIVSYTDMWVLFEPTEEIVNLNTVTWPCTDVNQAIMIALSSDADEISITVTRKDPDLSQEVPWIIHKNTPAPQKFVMPDFVNVDAFDDCYVDITDDVIDDAILGDDGYYHLNDKNGPVLFANLNESVMSLYTMASYGSVAAVQYDDNGDVTKKVDYTEAFNEYVAALPTDNSGNITSYYYPLTDDLIEIFKEVGSSHDWYSADGAWIYASEDAWLYACYFDEAVTILDLSSSDNNNNNNNTNDGSNGIAGGATTNTPTTNTNTDANNNTNTSTDTNNDSATKSPTTGDSVASLSIAMLSAAALVIGVKIKKQ